MPGLIQRRLRRSGGDRGAVAVLIALLFGSGVFLGLAALVVDVGGMYAEKAQLQNGADSGALAVAEGCALGTGSCSASTASSGLAGALANQNANDGKTTVDTVCGSDGYGGSYLPTCAAAAACPAATPTGNYVRVQTSTLATNGSTVLPPAFGKAVMGSSWLGEHVQSCAQASWGSPTSLGNAVAFTISYCEWQQDTGAGPTFARYPPWPPSYLQVKAGTATLAKSENVLVLHGDTGTTSCNPGSDSAGWDAPGAFGWVGSGSSCSVAITNNTYPANPGNNAINACVATFQAAYSTHAPIFIPIYTGTTGTGSNVIYSLKGFAAFIVTGWDLTSGNSGWKNSGGTVQEPSLVALSEGANNAQANYCKKPVVNSNSDVCVYGFFTQALVPASAVPSGPGGSNLGASSVSLTG